MNRTPTGRTTGRWQTLIGVLLPVFVYVLAALLVSWPAVIQLGTHGLGAGYGDQFENTRLVWWTQYALQHGLSPFYQSLLGYPDGFFSAAQWAQPLGYLPAVILSFVSGPVAAVSLWTIIELVLNGLSAFILCQAVLKAISDSNTTRSEESQTQNSAHLSLDTGKGSGAERSPCNLAALIGGLVFMTFPAMQGHLSAGHINVLALYGFPLYALCLWRVSRGTARWRTVFLGALLIVVTATGDTDQAVYTLLPLTLFWLAYQAGWQRSTFWTRRVMRQLLVMLAAGFVFLLPFFVPLAMQLSTPNKTADLQQGGWVIYSTDPLSFVSLSPFTPWGARVAANFTRTVLGTNSTEGAAYLGLVVGLLSLVAIIAYARRRWLRALLPWLTVAVGAAIFSLGPFLKWADQPITYSLGSYKSFITLPWAWFQALPILTASRTPGRFNLTTGLAISVIAAAGACFVLGRISRRTVQIGVTTVLLVAIGFDYQLFAPALTTSAAVPGYMADLAKRNDVRAVFDIPWDDNLAAKDALYWQTTHHKPLLAGQTLRTTPVDPAKLNLLQAIITGRGSTPLALALLNQAGVDLVIVHLSALPPDIALNTISARLQRPIFRDDRIAVYNVPKTAQPLASQDLISTISADRQSMSVYAPTSGYIRFPGEAGQSAAFTTVDGQIGGLYGGGLFVIGGYHTIQHQPAISFVAPRPTFEPVPQTVPLHLGQQLTLAAIKLEQTREQIWLNTTWRADKTIDQDYHYFVHLVDSTGGQVVAQFDGQPGGGKFPTSQWRAGQIWTESTMLAVDGLAPGVYRVQIGWYSYPDMRRLTVDGQSGAAADGLIDGGQVLIPAAEDYF